MEPRKHAALEFVLHNFLKNLSDDWVIMIFHGIDNIEYLYNIMANMPEQYIQRISLINMGIANLTRDEYSRMLTSEDFYNSIPTETFLIFQTDAMIFADNKHLINNFLQFDYVGAPWPHSSYVVGNGGLSLRKKSKMLEIIRTIPYAGESEDVYFCKQIAVPLYRPSAEEAKWFSVENIFAEKSFGCHQGWISYVRHPRSKYYNDVFALRKLQYTNP